MLYENSWGNIHIHFNRLHYPLDKQGEKLMKMQHKTQIFLFIIAQLVIVSTYAEDSIPYLDQTIKINPSGRLLVTEIDIDKVMSRYIEDYDVFEKSLMIGYSSLTWIWRVKPDPNDPETRYFWGVKRDTDFYKRKINISIGIFPSHEEAIRRAIDEMRSMAAVVPLINNGEKEPGYVAWIGDIQYGIIFSTL